MVYTEDEKIWIWLASIDGIGVRRFYQLMSLFDSPNELIEALQKNSTVFSFIGGKVLEKMKQGRNDGYGHLLIEKMEEQGIIAIARTNSQYPRMLEEIFDPPPVLFVRGDEKVLNTLSLGVVGTRKCTRYGRETARSFSRAIASKEITIVSGMARGIDSESHIGALEAEGKTVAVLGCGVDTIYPPENLKLFYQIIEHGAVISEYAPGVAPMAGNFPARNRIISGLSRGVLIVEADIKSGTMFTVDYANQQGREVYCVPGNINSPSSRGTNKLIKDGARMALAPEDILSDYGITYTDEQMQNTAQFQLDIFEQQIVSALLEGELNSEELFEKTQMEAAQLNTLLTLLELRGIIRQHAGRIFSINTTNL